MNSIKLNVGASPIWRKDGWHTLDHKPRSSGETSIIGDAAAIPLDEASCSILFCSHMIEHVPHMKLEDIFLEFNRVLEKDGVIRLLSPDLKKIATAYVERDEAFFKHALSEDENIRTDLGFGGMFMNFVVSPGQDTALFNRDLTDFISGYAHIYLYDYEMLAILLEHCGFHSIEQHNFCESKIPDLEEPLHVVGLEPEWQDFNKAFYGENNLVHYYDDKTGKYDINFEVTGFDRDPLTSLIVEARKEKSVNKDKFQSLNFSEKNYNRYGQSLLKDTNFNLKSRIMSEISGVINNPNKTK